MDAAHDMWRSIAARPRNHLRIGVAILIGLVAALLVLAAKHNGASPARVVSVARGAEVGQPVASVPAFPGAEGWGAQSVGGRGGRVIEVTNLDDSGAGSLRACAEASGPRTCVFRVNGAIELKSSIEIRHPYLTIAGQTAPGGGIYIRSAPGNAEGINGLIKFPEPGGDIGESPHDVIIRYLRIRHGRSPTQKFEGVRPKNLEIWSGYNIIIDHVSLGWVNDNLMTIITPSKDDVPPLQYITVQRSIFAESLQGHSTGLNIQGQGEGDQKYWKNVKNISIHHNVFANNGSRNPRVTSAGTKVINNVIYNWRYHAAETTRGSVVDWIGNYWKPGPASNVTQVLLHENRPGEGLPPYTSDPSIYLSGNVDPITFPDPNTDNWRLYSLPYEHDAPVPAGYRRYAPLPSARFAETIQSAADAYASVLEDVGANRRLDCAGRWVFYRDAIDRRVIGEVRNNTGSPKTLYDEQSVGGFPEAAPAAACPDADRDGMPDQWELIYGFNPDDAGDGSQDADGDGYTNLEEFLNATNPREARG